MKIVSEIPHPKYKITIFRSGFKYIVKFDRPEGDFAFKFQDGQFDSLEDLIALVKDKLLSRVDELYNQLSVIRSQALQNSGSTRSDQYPKIV